MPTCKSCGAEIMFLKTPRGKYVPADPGVVWILPSFSGDVAGVTAFGDFLRGGRATEHTPGAKGIFVSHFATCPNAKQHRKANPKPRNFFRR